MANGDAYEPIGPFDRWIINPNGDLVGAYFGRLGKELRFDASTGSSLIGFIQSGTGAVARNLQDALLDLPLSVFNFFTADEIADVRARTRTIDVAPKINAAITALSFAGRKGGTLYFPPGSYRIDSSITVSIISVCLRGDSYGEPASEPVTEIWKNFNGVGILVSNQAGGGQVLRWGLEGLVVNGNGNTGDNIYVYNAHYGRIEHVVSWNCSGATSCGIHMSLSYSNTLHNVQCFSNYRNYMFENQTHDINATKCYSSTCTDYGFYITGSWGLSFYGSTHEGTGTIGIWINRNVFGCVFDGGYIEVTGGAGYSSVIRISEDTLQAGSVRGIAIRNMYMRINTSYSIPILLRSGIYGCQIDNCVIEYNGVTNIDSNSRGVLVGWAVGAVAVQGVHVRGLHCKLTSCTGSGLVAVSAAANVVANGVTAVNCTVDGDALTLSLNGTNSSFGNPGAVNGNSLAALDFVNFASRSSSPTYLQTASLVYADGVGWNPTSTGEGLHVVKSDGTLKRVASHHSTTTSARPNSGEYPGMFDFDTTLNKPVWAKTVGTKEVDTITVTAGATSSGNITVTLNGVGTTVAVVAGDTAGGVGDKIKAKATTGWATSGTAGTGIVAITKTTTGTNTTPTFTDTGTTGVTASFAVTTAGVATVWVDATGSSV